MNVKNTSDVWDLSLITTSITPRFCARVIYSFTSFRLQIFLIVFFLAIFKDFIELLSVQNLGMTQEFTVLLNENLT